MADKPTGRGAKPPAAGSSGNYVADDVPLTRKRRGFSVVGPIERLSRLGGPGLAIVLACTAFFFGVITWIGIQLSHASIPVAQTASSVVPIAAETPFYVVRDGRPNDVRPTDGRGERTTSTAARPQAVGANPGSAHASAGDEPRYVDAQGRVRPGVIDRAVSPPRGAIGAEPTRPTQVADTNPGVPNIATRGEAPGGRGSELAQARAASLVQADDAPVTVSLGDGVGDAAAERRPTPGDFNAAPQAPPPLGDAATGIEGTKAGFYTDVASRGANEVVPTMKHGAFRKYEIFAGSTLPVVLDTAINTDLPGSTIVARIRDDVYDSRYGRYLLIPRQTRLIGSYDQGVRPAQNKVNVVWSRLVWPDGSSMPIGSMAGTNTRGEIGLDAHVTEHRGRMLESLLPLAGIATVAGVLAPNGVSGYGQQSVGSSIAANVGGELSQASTQIVQRNGAIPPTLTVPRGIAFDVLVDRDLPFESPYAAQR